MRLGAGALLVQRALPDMLVQRSVAVDGMGSALGFGVVQIPLFTHPLVMALCHHSLVCLHAYPP